MKILFLIALFAGTFVNPAFSQPNNCFKWDTDFKNQSSDTTQVYDQMPVIVPKGNYSMIIVKPDPAMKYYLWIIKP